jgi:hypothetical protein
MVKETCSAGAWRYAQAEEEYLVEFTFRTVSKMKWWDLGPLMINEAPDAVLRAALNKSVETRSAAARDEDKQLEGYENPSGFEASDDDFQTIKIQFRALGLNCKKPTAPKRKGYRDVLDADTLR